MNIEHEVITVKLADLKSDPRNPNQMTAEQRHALEKSLKEFKNIRLILVDQNNVIIDGHQRVDEMRNLGVEETQAIRYHIKSESERIKIRQVLNKLYGQHDKKMDANDYLVLFQEGQLAEFAELLARPQEEFQRSLEKYHGLQFTAEDSYEYSVEETQETTTKPGDIWELGNHRIICGDCRNRENMDRLSNGQKFDQVLTDPPYGVNYGEKNRFLNKIFGGHRIDTGFANDDPLQIDYQQFFFDCLSIIPLAEYNTVYVFNSPQHLCAIKMAAEKAGYTHSDFLIWMKNNQIFSTKDYKPIHEYVFYGWKGKHRFYGGFSTAVLEYDRPQQSKLHPTMKPIALMARLVKDGSQPGDKVYDAFLGSGSTLIACEQTGRTCYGMEISPHYCDVIVTRWEKLTGKKAKLHSRLSSAASSATAATAETETGKE